MGIYDRDYYREDSRWSNPFARSQGTLFLALLYFFMFIAQVATEVEGQRNAAQKEGLTEALQLSVDSTLKGEVWRVISYTLVHEPGNIFHLVFTIGFLIWIGHQVEDLYGTKEYLTYFVFTSLLGGAAYTAIGVFSPGTPPLLGPSGAVTAILILFALHYPTWRFFFFPIWLVIAIYALIDVAGMMGQTANPARVAVHLTGAAFAFVYHTYTLRVSNWLPLNWGSRKTVRRQSQPKLRSRPQTPEPEPAATASVTASASAKVVAAAPPVDEHLEAKLDEVLQKVQKYGKESLSDAEREILLKASEVYKKRRQSS
jgi:membrane associated rhomboid family serine protease